MLVIPTGTTDPIDLNEQLKDGINLIRINGGTATGTLDITAKPKGTEDTPLAWPNTTQITLGSAMQEVQLNICEGDLDDWQFYIQPTSIAVADARLSVGRLSSLGQQYRSR